MTYTYMLHMLLVSVKGVIKCCLGINFGPLHTEEHCLISKMNSHKQIKDKTLPELSIWK